SARGTAGAGSLSVDVAFIAAEGATVAAPAATLVTLSQDSTTIHSTAAALVAGTTATYRFSFDAADLAALGDGAVSVSLGSWSDGSGATTAAGTLGSFTLGTPRAELLAPASGAVVGRDELGNLAVDVTLVAVPGATVPAPAAGLLKLTQAALQASGTPTLLRGTTYRFTFGSLPAFALGTIDLSLGGWSDSAGNAAAATTLGSVTLAAAPNAVVVTPGTGGAVG